MRKDPATRPGVAVVIDDGFSPLEFSVAYEIFGCDRSELGTPWYRFAVCGAHAGPVRACGHFSVLPDNGLAAVSRADTVVVPPLGEEGPYRPELVQALRAAHARGARIASLCTGAFVLAEAGLLDGRPATTHWRHADRLAECYPDVKVDPGVLYVDDGDILTSAGAAASMDLCLHMLRCDRGAEIANLVARRCVVPPHRDGGQAQYIEDPLGSPGAGNPFDETLAWARQHLAHDLTVEDLARRSAMSPRSFARWFRARTGTTPHRWVVRQRVLEAQRLLETTELSIDDIALATGLGTAANLRAHFSRTLQAAPSAYRRTFRRSAVPHS